jgi:hypothetical protein
MAALGGRDVAWAEVPLKGITGKGGGGGGRGGSGEEEERKRRDTASTALSSSRSAFVLLALPRTPKDMRQWLAQGSGWDVEQDEDEEESEVRAREEGLEEEKKHGDFFPSDSKEREEERATIETEENTEKKMSAKERKKEEALGKVFAEEALPKTLCARARQLGVRLCFVDATPYAEDIVRTPDL